MTNHLTISQFFDRVAVFSVPSYQRAYAWGDEQLRPFYDDIATQPAEKTCFFGAILLEENGEFDGCVKYHIVDGQQRLTTTVIFVGELLEALARAGKGEDLVCKKARRAYIIDEGIPKFCTIADDEAFFDSYIRKDNPLSGSFSSLSQERLWYAKSFFRNKLQDASVENLLALMNTINNLHIINYTVTTPEDAARLFKLKKFGNAYEVSSQKETQWNN